MQQERLRRKEVFSSSGSRTEGAKVILLTTYETGSESKTVIQTKRIVNFISKDRHLFFGEDASFWLTLKFIRLFNILIFVFS